MNETSTLLHSSRIEPRWGDQDALGHANNAVYLSWLEEARLRWLLSLPGPWNSETASPVLARAEINYRRPLIWPQPLRIELYALRLGSSSLTLGHRIHGDDVDGLLFADGQVVMVWVDPKTGRSVPLPEPVRRAAAG